MGHIKEFFFKLICLDGRGEYQTWQSYSECSMSEPNYWCRDCLGGSLLCRTCIVKSHAIHSTILRYVFFYVIYHWSNWSLILKHWNSKFFECNTLKTLDGCIQLRHTIGKPCPLPMPAFGDSFTIIHINGIHDVGLDFFGCGKHGTMAQQLLWFCLYPATVQNPNTATTFCALHHFQLLSFESKYSVYEFYQTLVCEFDNTLCRKIKVCVFQSLYYPNWQYLKNCYKALLQMVQQWHHLKMHKCSGFGHFSNESEEDGHSCALIRPACLQPGINLPPGWEQAPKEKRFVIYNSIHTHALNQSQFIVGYVHFFLLLMGTFEWVKRVCHQKHETPAWLRDVDILSMMTN